MKRGNAQYLDCGTAVHSTVIHVYTLICILKKILQNFHQRTQVLFTFIFDCLNLSTHFFISINLQQMHIHFSCLVFHSLITYKNNSMPTYQHIQLSLQWEDSALPANKEAKKTPQSVIVLIHNKPLSG